jgi:hypothetical protein
MKRLTTLTYRVNASSSQASTVPNHTIFWVICENYLASA